MTDRKTNRDLLDELERADAYSMPPYEKVQVSVTSLHKVIVSRFRNLLDRVDIVNDRADFHPIPELSEPLTFGYSHGFDVGYATACKDCKEDLSDERS